MGVYLCYHFNYPKDVKELIGDVSDKLWFRPWREERGTYWSANLGVTYWLNEPNYLTSEGDLNFEDYHYSLNTKLVYRPAMFHHTQLAMMLSVIYMLYRGMEIKSGMLTWDAGRLLAKYEERDDALYDLVSDMPFTNFAEHMKAIEAKIPREWRD